VIADGVAEQLVIDVTRPDRHGGSCIFFGHIANGAESL
jgi:hypothetical protein